MPKILRPLLWLKTYLQLNKINTSEILGVLSFWLHDGALVGGYFAKRKGVKHLSWVTGQDAKKGNPFVSLIRPKPMNLIAMSDFLADQFEKNYSIRPDHVVPNGVNPVAFPPSKVERTIDLLAAGSLIPLKQYSIFVDVVAELIKVKASLQAVLCGAGPETEMLTNKIATLKLQHAITLKGELQHEQVLAMMTQSKIFLHPSSYEGYSTVCLEALFAGCHVISFIAPEKRVIAHWRIAGTKEDMISQCKTILQHEVDFSSVLVHNMDDCARRIVGLFGYAEVITS
jgi:glycosyltransferase involved in cell wall biosynthesis